MIRPSIGVELPPTAAMVVGAVRQGRLARRAARISPKVFFGGCEQACAIKAPSLRASKLCISGKRYTLAAVGQVIE